MHQLGGYHDRSPYISPISIADAVFIPVRFHELDSSHRKGGEDYPDPFEPDPGRLIVTFFPTAVYPLTNGLMVPSQVLQILSSCRLLHGKVRCHPDAGNMISPGILFPP